MRERGRAREEGEGRKREKMLHIRKEREGGKKGGKEDEDEGKRQ